MIVLLETPGTILGSLWGVVLVMHFFHLSAEISSWIMMSMLLGSIIGSPLLGKFSDRHNNKPWIIVCSVIACSIAVLLMFTFQSTHNLLIIALLFFSLGFFCSCQTVAFHWLTSNMKPALIGRNSAFNSMVFMSFNGGLKQFSAYLLSIPAILFFHAGSAGNLLTVIFVSMILVVLYLCVRKWTFKNQQVYL